MKSAIGVLAICLGCNAGLAAPAIDTMSDQELRAMVFELKGEVDALRSEQDTTWLTEQRAEQVRGLVLDVLADADTRAALQGSGMTSGYDKGFFLASGDGNWLMKINSQIQVRWHFNDASDQADVHGFEIRRAKLKFSGHIIDPSWGYKLTVVSNRQSGLDTPANVFIEDAYINKKLDNGMYVRMGQFKAPFLREELVSSSRQLAVDRSIVNNAFTWGRTQGIMLGYEEDAWKINAMYNNGPNDQNTQIAGSPSTNGITARAEVLLGDGSEWSMFKGLNARNTNGQTGFMLGGALGWFNSNFNGVQEYGNGDVARSLAFTIDGSIAGDGWTLMSYLVWAWGKDRYLETVNSPNAETDQDSLGVVVQGGYLMQEDLELFARYSYGDIEDADFTGTDFGAPAAAGDNLSVLTIGANYFVNSNIKFTMDWGYAFDTVTDGGTGPTSADYTTSGTGWRPDNNGDADGQWLLRAQMQLLF